MTDLYQSNSTSGSYSEEDVYATIPTVTLQYINQAFGQPIDPSKQIPELSIVTVMLADALITSAKIAEASIYSAHIQSAQITNAHIDRASVNKLTVVSADIATAQINDLHFDRSTGNKIKILNGDIVNINAAKLNAGTINTSLVSIQGNNANLKITGDRLQVFDKQAIPKERVSIGDVDANGTVFGLRVRGADGTTVLYDHNGVYSQGITNGAVTNPKIGDDAVDGRVIAADSVTAEHIVVTDLSAISANIGTITSGTINGATFNTTHTTYGTITMSGGNFQSRNVASNQYVDINTGFITARNTTRTKQTEVSKDVIKMYDDTKVITASETYWSELTANQLKFSWGTETQNGYASIRLNRNESPWEMILSASGGVRILEGLTVDSNIYSYNMTITSTNDGSELLRFNTPRPWKFMQQGVDGTTKLALKCESTDKFFTIQDSSGAESFVVQVSGTAVNRYAYTPKLLTDKIQGSSDSNIVNLGDSHCYIDTTGDIARFQRDSTNYLSVGSAVITTYVGGRGVVSFRVGDNGTTHSFIQGQGSGLQLLGGGGVQVRDVGNTAYGAMYASAFTPSSLRSLKKNITPFTDDAINLVNGTTVYNYNYTNELDTEFPHTGIILDEAPVWLADIRGLGVDLYAMTSVLWKAVQELSSEINKLKSKVG